MTDSYFDNTGDQRLQTIQNQTGSTQLSRFDYTYNKVGTIATWTQQADSSTAVLNTLTYDNADQLVNAVQSGGATASNAYGYDPAGNRLAEVTGSGTTAGQFNTLNQLTGTSTVNTGTQTVTGYTSAPITNALVNAVPATISNNTNFTAHVPLPLGTNVVSVIAQPSSGVASAITKRYQIVMSSGAAVTPLTYDVNGNCTKDEHGNTYTWDALNRLTKITYLAGGNSTFAYDGLSRRVQIVDTTSGGAVTTKNYLWVGSEIAEERSSSNAVTKRFFPQGEQQSPSGTNTPFYYTYDHLGSVRELCSSSGSIVARYSYDPYGRTTLVSGSNLATYQYAGYYQHQVSGLELTLYRAFDSNTGRWLSRDPIGENAGINIYLYVSNNPTSDWDPLGLCQTTDDAGATCCCNQISIVTLSTDTRDFPPHSFITTKVGGWGYFPAIPYAPTSPGTVENNTKHYRNHYQVYRACPSTLSKLLRSISSHTGGWYDGLNGPPGHNCTGWACNRLNDAGLTPPANGNQPGLTPYNTQ